MSYIFQMIFYEGSPEINIDSSWRQRASGFTLVFMKPPKTFMFHPSEQKGLQAWVLLSVRLSVPLWLATGYPGLCCFEIKCMMLLISSQDLFLTLRASHHGRRYVDCFWLAHDGCSRSLWAVCGVQQVTLGVSPLSSHLDITIFVQHPWTHTHGSNSSIDLLLTQCPVWSHPQFNLSPTCIYQK